MKSQQRANYQQIVINQDWKMREISQKPINQTANAKQDSCSES